MTLGERRVRTEFNPSQNDVVSRIKQASAELINVVDGINIEMGDITLENQDAEFLRVQEMERLKELALDFYETAAMFAVKLATYDK